MLQQLFRKTVIIFFLVTAGCTVSFAQVYYDSLATGKGQPLNHSVPDSLARRVSEIIIIGNKLTKASIILRELTFRKGDTLQPLALEKIFLRSEDNLMNTSLFNSAHITWLINDSKTMTVYIILAERWYI